MVGDSKLVIIAVDGGISSQIAFVAFGMYLEELYGDQVKVAYDLSWYERFSHVADVALARKWDFQKAFPRLKIAVSDSEVTERWRRWFCITGLNAASKLRMPAYLDGYPLDRYRSMFRYRDLFRAHFNPDLSDRDRSVLQTIGQDHSCGVHVRRGDLALGNPGYGKPTSVSYYQTACRVIRGLDPLVRFFFFSDEPEWVKIELISKLPAEWTVTVVEGNDATRGYADLYLLSQCDYIVSSIGSFGPMAALLSSKCRWCVMSRRHATYLDGLEHCIYINDDRDLDKVVRREDDPFVPVPKRFSIRHFSFLFHRAGWSLRRSLGIVSEESYELNILRLKRKYLDE